MNWEETKKNSKQYLGKTPAYMLDAFGFDETNLDVTVRMDLSIKGQMLDNQYLWTVTFKTKFGKNSSTDCLISALIASNDKPSIGSKINS